MPNGDILPHYWRQHECIVSIMPLWDLPAFHGEELFSRLPSLHNLRNLLPKWDGCPDAVQPGVLL